MHICSSYMSRCSVRHFNACGALCALEHLWRTHSYAYTKHYNADIDRTIAANDAVMVVSAVRVRGKDILWSKHKSICTGAQTIQCPRRHPRTMNTRTKSNTTAGGFECKFTAFITSVRVRATIMNVLTFWNCGKCFIFRMVHVHATNCSAK